ncbi:hypothetical protein C8Q79DRAFT_532552 [Trametes meyenii]|nr:hypothetical protein C8Q79DRAFT_532552 [Trametes meyenii]
MRLCGRANPPHVQPKPARRILGSRQSPQFDVFARHPLSSVQPRQSSNHRLLFPSSFPSSSSAPNATSTTPIALGRTNSQTLIQRFMQTRPRTSRAGARIKACVRLVPHSPDPRPPVRSVWRLHAREFSPLNAAVNINGDDHTGRGHRSDIDINAFRRRGDGAVGSPSVRASDVDRRRGACSSASVPSSCACCPRGAARRRAHQPVSSSMKNLDAVRCRAKDERAACQCRKLEASWTQ